MHFLQHFVHPYTTLLKPLLISTANLWGKVHSQLRFCEALRYEHFVIKTGLDQKKKIWPVTQPCIFTKVAAIA
jgi:hypothetical protein